MSPDWTPNSWRSKPIKQEVAYEDGQAAEKAFTKLRSLPPLVTPEEIVRLKNELKDVASGKAFLLQGGDCAELFSYCESSAIDAKMKLLLQMSLVLIWGGNRRVVRIGRMAGQYAKPRSSPTEMVDGKEIPAFRGDILNGYPTKDRVVDPARLVEAYFHSSTTLNHIRSQLASGFADLHNHTDWELGHVKNKEIKDNYTSIATSIKDSLHFMSTVGADTNGNLHTVNLYTSHEALVLPYEECLTRRFKHPPNRKAEVKPLINGAPLTNGHTARDDSHGWYDTSAHFVWIGDRTRQLDHAHVEFFRGLENPIGIKIGPSMEAAELQRLLDIVNPRKEVGKVVLISRYGEKKVEELLGPHIDAVRESGHTVIWQCDPMHGNTFTTEDGIKTRRFSSIFVEVAAALRIHKEHRSSLGGIHLELTGEAVTECTGGSEGIVEDDLSLNYTTFCDPRLNQNQALELAFLVAGHYRNDAVSDPASVVRRLS